MPSFRALFETTKPRLTRLVAITALMGLAIGLLRAGVTDVGVALWTALTCVLGTACCAASANTLNQYTERALDRRMQRTSGRPLPSGRLTPASVLRFGLLAGAFGGVVLALAAGWIAAAIGVLSIAIYVLIYTPMKTRTPWCTLVGAVPGALPPLIGWAAAAQASTTHGLEPIGWLGGWSLVGLMVVWQMPHFWAIAWMYRDDYAAGGFRVLPAIDRDGQRTARSIRLWSLGLIPASLLPWWAMPDLIGPAYAVAAIVMGVLFVLAGLRVAESRAKRDARRLFFASIAYLPLLLAVLAADAAWTALV